MSTQRYTPEFKEEAVRQVVQRGHTVAKVSARWAAAGFEDTMLGWNLKLEVVHGNEAGVYAGVQA